MRREYLICYLHLYNIGPMSIFRNISNFLDKCPMWWESQTNFNNKQKKITPAYLAIMAHATEDVLHNAYWKGATL